RYRPGTPAEDAATLARLGEGSIGRALTLAEEGGLELYRKVGGLLVGLPELDGPALHALADRFGRKGGEAAFHTAAELLVWWLGRMIRSGATGAFPAEIVPGEAAAMSRLLAGHSLDRWLELWDKTSRLFASTEGANLD